jgi:hypothetical protein
MLSYIYIFKTFTHAAIIVALDMAELIQSQTKSLGDPEGAFTPICTSRQSSTMAEAQ